MTYKDDLLPNYDHEIPEELIAQKPTENKQNSKLFIVNRRTQRFYHRIINIAKVVPSRLFGRKKAEEK
jgi:S-adenosylmethionine:tRNA ribosyltransferase-isomerase